MNYIAPPELPAVTYLEPFVLGNKKEKTSTPGDNSTVTTTTSVNEPSGKWSPYGDEAAEKEKELRENVEANAATQANIGKGIGETQQLENEGNALNNRTGTRDVSSMYAPLGMSSVLWKSFNTANGMTANDTLAASRAADARNNRQYYKGGTAGRVGAYGSGFAAPTYNYGKAPVETEEMRQQRMNAQAQQQALTSATDLQAFINRLPAQQRQQLDSMSVQLMQQLGLNQQQLDYYLARSVHSKSYELPIDQYYSAMMKEYTEDLKLHWDTEAAKLAIHYVDEDPNIAGLIMSIRAGTYISVPDIMMGQIYGHVKQDIEKAKAEAAAAGKPMDPSEEAGLMASLFGILKQMFAGAQFDSILNTADDANKNLYNRSGVGRFINKWLGGGSN